MHDAVACDALSKIVSMPYEAFRDSTKSTWMIPLQFNCCGIHSDKDYNGTDWWKDKQVSGSRKQVPLTCCVLKNSEVLYILELIDLKIIWIFELVE